MICNYNNNCIKLEQLVKIRYHKDIQVRTYKLNRTRMGFCMMINGYMPIMVCGEN